MAEAHLSSSISNLVARAQACGPADQKQGLCRIHSLEVAAAATHRFLGQQLCAGSRGLSQSCELTTGCVSSGINSGSSLDWVQNEFVLAPGGRGANLGSLAVLEIL